MKNPTLTTASVFLGLAVTVGGFAWYLSGDDGGETGDVLTRSVSEATEVSFEPITPREIRKKGRLEAAVREMKRIKKVGEQVAPDTYKIDEEWGETLYVTKLIEGRGRNGEPLYATAAAMKVPEVPLKKAPLAPAGAAGKMVDKRGEMVLGFGQNDGKPIKTGKKGGVSGGDTSDGKDSSGKTPGKGGKGPKGGSAGSTGDGDG